jgi:hypothetical protein
MEILEIFSVILMSRLWWQQSASIQAFKKYSKIWENRHVLMFVSNPQPHIHVNGRPFCHNETMPFHCQWHQAGACWLRGKVICYFYLNKLKPKLKYILAWIITKGLCLKLITRGLISGVENSLERAVSSRQVSCLELFTEPDKKLIFQWLLIEQLQCNFKLLPNGGMSSWFWLLTAHPSYKHRTVGSQKDLFCKLSIAGQAICFCSVRFITNYRTVKVNVPMVDEAFMLRFQVKHLCSDSNKILMLHKYGNVKVWANAKMCGNAVVYIFTKYVEISLK